MFAGTSQRWLHNHGSVLHETSRAAAHVDYDAHRTYNWQDSVGQRSLDMGDWVHGHMHTSKKNIHLDKSTSSEYFPQCRKTKKLQNMKPLELRDSIASKAAFWSFEAHSSVVWIWPGSFGEFGPLPPDQQVDHCASFDMPGPDEEDPKLRPEPEKNPKIWYCQ